ncbi:MAG: GtrA family protein [Actinomycetaceae bacterium]|nr:GtrA family protein [Actinomycetaceae bacterium]
MSESRGPGARSRGRSPFKDTAPGARWGRLYTRKVREATRFLLVGGMNYVVDVGVFNALRATVLAFQPVTAKVISAVIATLFSWVVNRSWTFSAREKRPILQEFVGFMTVNALGLLPPVVCLWISHYLLHFTSQLADNISANIIGVGLGTLLRYVGYSKVVFGPDKDATSGTHGAVHGIDEDSASRGTPGAVHGIEATEAK